MLGTVWLVVSAAWLAFGRPTVVGMRAPFRTIAANRAFAKALGWLYLSLIFGWIFPFAYAAYLVVGRRN